MRAALFFGQLVEDRGLRPVMTVQHDNVAEALAGQTFQHITHVRAIRLLADRKRTRVSIQAAGHPISKAPAWCGSIRERNLVHGVGSWQTERRTGSGSRPIPQWCC